MARPPIRMVGLLTTPSKLGSVRPTPGPALRGRGEAARTSAHHVRNTEAAASLILALMASKKTDAAASRVILMHPSRARITVRPPEHGEIGAHAHFRKILCGPRARSRQEKTPGGCRGCITQGLGDGGDRLAALAACAFAATTAASLWACIKSRTRAMCKISFLA